MAKARAMVEFDFLGSLGKPEDGSGLPLYSAAATPPSDPDRFRFCNGTFFASDLPPNGNTPFAPKCSAVFSSASAALAPAPVAAFVANPLTPTAPSLPELNAGPGNEVKAQLTIFYDGKVNVYENVPADRAYAIMLLAGRGVVETAPPHLNNNNNINNNNNNNNIIIDNNPIPSAKAGSPAAPLQQCSVVAKNVVNNGNSDPAVPTPVLSDPNPNLMVEIAPSNKKSQCELPRARKASLARFLEKRKERILTKPTGTGLDEDDRSTGVEMPEKSSLKRPLSRASSPSPSRGPPRPTAAWGEQL